MVWLLASETAPMPARARAAARWGLPRKLKFFGRRFPPAVSGPSRFTRARSAARRWWAARARGAAGWGDGSEGGSWIEDFGLRIAAPPGDPTGNRHAHINNRAVNLVLLFGSSLSFFSSLSLTEGGMGEGGWRLEPPVFR